MEDDEREMVQAGATLVSKEARGAQSGKVRLKWARGLTNNEFMLRFTELENKRQRIGREKYRGYENEENGGRRGSLLSGRAGKEAALALELARSQNITNKPSARPFYRYPQVAFSTTTLDLFKVNITNQRQQYLILKL